MNLFKSHFLYDRRKRSGILILAAIITASIIFLNWYQPEQNPVISEQEKEEVLLFQKKVDSLKALALESKKPKIYPFNPNYITDYRGYTLGMSVEEIDRLRRFRESGQWINSAADFKKVAKVSDSLLAAISPYFKFPDWVTNPKPKKQYAQTKKWKTFEEKRKLNSVSIKDLVQIEGIDEAIANKIISYRNKIGGFLIDGQLYDVYGVPSKVKREILNHFTVKEKPVVTRININTTNASDLSTIPLLNYDLAKEIVDYRILHERFNSLDELIKIEGMTDYKYERIKLYLMVE